MPRLIDKSGGFWTDFINRRKTPAQFIKQNLIPDSRIMRKVGEEAISSVKGSVKHKIVIKYLHGNLVMNSFSNGSYSNGILKRRSIDGDEYEPLKDSTLRSREWKASEGLISSNRGADFIERETSNHILNGMKVKSVNETSKTASCTIGWEGENEVIADAQDKGKEVTTQWFDKGELTVKVPAHHFIGFQKEFIDNYFDMMSQLF